MKINLNLRLSTGQFYRKKLNQNHLTSLSMFEIESSLKFFSIFSIFLISILIFNILPSFNSTKKMILIVKNLIGIQHNLTKRLNIVSLILIFYMLYWMVFKSILSNNINSKKIVVDTSDIVQEREEILGTKKTICFWNDESELTLVENSRKGSFLYKILTKSKNKLCTFNEKDDSFQMLNLDEVVLLINRIK